MFAELGAFGAQLFLDAVNSHADGGVGLAQEGSYAGDRMPLQDDQAEGTHGLWLDLACHASQARFQVLVQVEVQFLDQCIDTLGLGDSVEELGNVAVAAALLGGSAAAGAKEILDRVIHHGFEPATKPAPGRVVRCAFTGRTFCTVIS